MAQLSYLYMTIGKTITLTIWTSVRKVITLFFNTLSSFVWLFFQGESILISWLQSPSTVILEPKKINSVNVPVFPFLQFSYVQSLSHVRLFVTPWTAAHQATLSITNTQSLLKLMSIASVMPSSHLILCHPLLLLPSIFPSIRVFSNESVLHIRWPKYWSFSFSISEYSGLISFRMDWLDLLAV